MAKKSNIERQGLYNPSNEHDACGVGFVANIHGKKSHEIVAQGLTILDNLTHRGATGYDPKLGDGAGLLSQIPHEFFLAEANEAGFKLPEFGHYGIGMLFLPQDDSLRNEVETLIEKIVEEEGQSTLGWRGVPVDNSDIADAAKEVEPVIKQIFIQRSSECDKHTAFERKLFVIRKRIEIAVNKLNPEDSAKFYIPSMSSRTIVYKGMLLAAEVGVYFTDLKDEKFTSAIALVHQRFSTNTFPSWDLAHPFRMIAHNGEINTVQGNVNWMHARHETMKSMLLGEDLEKLWPLIEDGQSDSACFDNCLELLVAGGYSLPHAMMMLIPEAWAGNPLMDKERKAFYEYHAALMEPWDGPAAVAFTDGQMIGATLDRNGLRPARYLMTDDGVVMMASEMGVLTFPEEKIVKKWRLEPGKMLLIDTDAGRVIDDQEVKKLLASAKPYEKWVNDSRFFLGDLDKVEESQTMSQPILDIQQSFGYSQEDIKFILQPMFESGQEASGSMGNDAALPVLSNKAKSLYNYFKQLFAQVTNPPIDPIREEIVMSLVTFIGPKPNLLGIEETNPPWRLEASQPVLSLQELEQLKSIEQLTNGHFKSKVIDITYEKSTAENAELRMQQALDNVCQEANQAIRDGFNILILSDRNVSNDRIAIPALLASSATHEFLVHEGNRTNAGLVVDTGSAREIHHFALLGGYGAEAICPWLVFETMKEITDDANQAQTNFIKAVGKGLYKIMSKMGISTFQSYCGAQIFEAIGLNSKFIEKYFTGTTTNIEGIGLAEVSAEAEKLHSDAFGNDPVLANALDAGGEYAFRIRGEQHMWNPESIAKLQHATRKKDFQTYKEYAELINNQSERFMTLRGLFQFKSSNKSISIDDVEPATEIVKRFATGAMSLGSISTEAHTTLAIAMNRIGGKSNTGEGGEDKKRFIPLTKDSSLEEMFGKDLIEANIQLKKGDSLRSKIKQVASGRFGVTAEYLAAADQIQIKMAQGAKPGEGGQLPGHKVSPYIAQLRFSVPGVGLISPPPHHDIYSIEDLAQLIHDLKNANPQADISVKLVSETGVGTVAAGVAKAKSDHIVIAGHDGGTGASPLSSIKHAGTPWELGLAETQQTLVLNKLRSRVILQVDGQMKTGRDVVIGALLGADEFGFATAPLVVEGCIMMRKCHLNTCPVGVATQDPELRKRFTGQPDHVVNYFFFIAEEVREIMAELGVKNFNDLIGRSDLLDMQAGIDHWKIHGLDFTKIFYRPELSDEVGTYHQETQDHGLDKALDHKLIKQAKDAIENKGSCVVDTPITNINRTAGTLLSHEIAKRYGNDGLPEDSIQVNLSGTAGQSFGAFLAKGITFNLEGEGNDYVGKGLCGGKIIIKPPKTFNAKASENIIVGNTVMYGATSGKTFFSGIAGERFCVRNSGASAVVEGVGNHGCEYMTGGTVAVLGPTGQNFAAGMSGGVAYIFDLNKTFEANCNKSMVTLEKVLPANLQPSEAQHLNQPDEVTLKTLVSDHLKYTNSEVAKHILDNWDDMLNHFVKVMPNEYRRALNELQEKTNKETV
ncbi:glutamate synthase, large subunit [beta proteobacterium KB13]|uniref:Glutamate synthase [NADPH] large chain n=1 Tax=beta proteobacterium KB13 TaxID=314607 RepID=B6BVX3_9PROT|nr:glutamate synthase, large subunit [beta proteobacterium KB13]